MNESKSGRETFTCPCGNEITFETPPPAAQSPLGAVGELRVVSIRTSAGFEILKCPRCGREATPHEEPK
jgi:hypothetical protein